MDDTQESITLDDIEESELQQAAQVPYVDNITTCSCRGMCLRERGRNACPCRTISQSCSSACHPDSSACMNTNSVLGGNSSESEEQSEESSLAMSDLEEQSGGASEGKERTRGRRQVRAGRAAGRTRGGRRGRRGGHRSYRDRSRSQERPRRSTRSGQGRGRGRLMPEVGSQQRIADHEVQLQRMVQNLNMEALQLLALELLRRQPAVFADIVNGAFPNHQEHQAPPEQDEPHPEHGHDDPHPEQEIPEWCMCGNCRHMPTQIENKCCCTRRMGCITTQPLFHQLVLDANVLDIAIRYREDVLVLENPRNNENFRHAAYRQYILWQHGRLGQGNRRVIPSCCVLAIRRRYPSPNGIYTGFRPARLP